MYSILLELCTFYVGQHEVVEMRQQLIQFSNELSELKTTLHQMPNAPSSSTAVKKKRIPKDLSVSLILYNMCIS